MLFALSGCSLRTFDGFQLNDNGFQSSCSNRLLSSLGSVSVETAAACPGLEAGLLIYPSSCGRTAVWLHRTSCEILSDS